MYVYSYLVEPIYTTNKYIQINILDITVEDGRMVIVVVMNITDVIDVITMENAVNI